MIPASSREGGGRGRKEKTIVVAGCHAGSWYYGPIGLSCTLLSSPFFTFLRDYCCATAVVDLCLANPLSLAFLAERERRKSSGLSSRQTSMLRLRVFANRGQRSLTRTFLT